MPILFLFPGESRGPGLRALRLEPWAPAFAGEQGRNSPDMLNVDRP